MTILSKKVARWRKKVCSLSKNDEKFHFFLKKNSSLVINTNNAILKTLPLNFPTELRSLTQGTKTMKNKFSKTNFSSNYSKLPTERIFESPTVKNLPQGREVLAQCPETMEKNMLSQKTFAWFLAQSTQFVKLHRQCFRQSCKV